MQWKTAFQKNSGVQGGMIMESSLSKAAISLMILAIVQALTGCAEPPPPKMKHSGFLGDYSGLQPGPRGGEVYVRPDADFSRYDKILIDPVVLRLTPEARGGISPHLMEKLAKDFHDSLETALKEGYTIVDHPGPDVLRIRTAITDLSPGRTVGVTDLGLGPGISVARPGEEPDAVIVVGSSTMEMEIADAGSGERLAAAVDRKGGAVGPEGASRSDSKAVFDYWAQRVRDRLDKLRKRSR
jgi:hypothetical protein